MLIQYVGYASMVLFSMSCFIEIKRVKIYFFANQKKTMQFKLIIRTICVVLCYTNITALFPFSFFTDASFQKTTLFLTIRQASFRTDEVILEFLHTKCMQHPFHKKGNKII